MIALADHPLSIVIFPGCPLDCWIGSSVLVEDDDREIQNSVWLTMLPIVSAKHVSSKHRPSACWFEPGHRLRLLLWLPVINALSSRMT